MAPDAFRLRPIGVVRSSLERREDAPRQGAEGAPAATISLEPSFVGALQGIAVGDEIIVLTWLHEAQRDVLQVHARRREPSAHRGLLRRDPATVRDSGRCS